MRLIREERSGYRVGPDGTPVKVTPEWVLQVYACDGAEGGGFFGLWVVVEVYPTRSRDKVGRSVGMLDSYPPHLTDGTALDYVKSRLLREALEQVAILDSEVQPLNCNEVGCGTESACFPYHRYLSFVSAQLRDGRHIRVCQMVYGALKQYKRLKEGTSDA